MVKKIVLLWLFYWGIQVFLLAQSNTLVQLIEPLDEPEKTQKIIEVVSTADDLEVEEIDYLYLNLIDGNPLSYGDANLLGDCFLSLGSVAYKKNSFELASRLDSIADTLFVVSKNMEARIKALLIISKSKRKLGNMKSALSSGMMALKLSDNDTSTMGYARSLQNLSTIYYYMGNLEESIRIDYKMVKIFEEQHDSLQIVLTYSNIAKTCCDISDFTNAIANYQTALKMAEKINDSLSIGDIYNDLGTVYFHQGKMDKAKNALLKSIQVNKSIGETFLLAISSLNYGDLLASEGDIEDGISYLHDSYQIFLGYEEMDFVANCLNSMGIAYQRQMKYDEAERCFNEALEIDEKYGTANSKKLHLNELYLFYAKTERYEDAYFTYLKYNQLVDSIESVEMKNTLLKLQTEHETYKKEQQIIQLQKDQELQQSKRELLIAIIVVIVFVFITFIGLIFLKRKKDRQLHRQKELYLLKEKQLAQSELEKSKIKEEELHQSILYKSKQLSTHALHMMQKNSMMHTIQADIKALSKKASIDDKPDYKRINLQINQSLRSDKDWDVFKLYFEEVNRDFYHQLDQINPDLTTNDHRLCALIKLNMNSKEMASVLNVAPNSIKSSRYRLKKKLGLDMEADLEEFIRNL